MQRQRLPESASRISSSLGWGCARAGPRWRRRGPACRSRTAPRPPRRTPPARDGARRSPASPSTVTTSWPSACAASTRHAQTSVPSRSTEHDPHSPCSHAFFDPGSPRLSRSAKRRLSPAQTSASRFSPLTVSSIFTPCTGRSRASSARAARGGDTRRCHERRRSGWPPLRRGRGTTTRRRAVRGRASAPARRSRTPREARPSTRTASETTAITIAFRGPTFMNVCLPPVSTSSPTTSSSSARTFCFGPTRKSVKATTRVPRTLASSTSRAGDEQRRQRVAGRRGRAEVPTDRAAVADLRRSDGARRLCERGQQAGERLLHRLRVGETRAEPQRPVLARPAAQLGHLVQVQEGARPEPVEVDRDHHVGAARDRDGVGPLRLQPQRLVQRERTQDVHGA